MYNVIYISKNESNIWFYFIYIFKINDIWMIIYCMDLVKKGLYQSFKNNNSYNSWSKYVPTNKEIEII